MPYLPYIWAQVVLCGRGELCYQLEDKNGHGDGFLLHLTIEQLDREQCESLSDKEEIWIRVRCNNTAGGHI